MAEPKTFKSSVLLRRITALEKAVEARSWAGAQPPEDRDALDRKYQKARLALIEYVAQQPRRTCSSRMLKFNPSTASRRPNGMGAINE